MVDSYRLTGKSFPGRALFLGFQLRECVFFEVVPKLGVYWSGISGVEPFEQQCIEPFGGSPLLIAADQLTDLFAWCAVATLGLGFDIFLEIFW